MATKSALLALVAGVAAYFADQGVTANVAPAGWRQRTQQLNQGPDGANRVLFIPGDRTGKSGPLTKPRINTANPRPLADWNATITMSVWAYDRTAPDDEAKQIEALEQLLERAMQGVHRAVDPVTQTPVGVANVIWGNVTWVVENTEMYFGREVLVEFVLRSQLYDAPYDTCTPQPAVSRHPITP